MVKNLTVKGKKVFIMSIPPTPIATSSKEWKEALRFINSKLSEMVHRIIKSTKSGMAAFLEDNDGNFNSATDFTDERHLAPIAMERLISKLDELLPETQKLKNINLKCQATCLPYRWCYGTYPIGCNFCTQTNHNEMVCAIKHGKEKRNRSTGCQEEGATLKRPKT